MPALVEVRWLVVRAGEVPAGDAWLGARERAFLDGLAHPARRASWRLGRWAAKRLLGEVEVLPDVDGAPVAWRGDRSLPVSLSISHRGGLGLCGATDGSVALGCDLELVEPRSQAFLADFLTSTERAAVAAASDPATLANLIWSAKESALKVLRTGLTRDTWDLEVTSGPGGELVIDDVRTGRRLGGAWRALDGFVATLACSATG